MIWIIFQFSNSFLFFENLFRNDAKKFWAKQTYLAQNYCIYLLPLLQEFGENFWPSFGHSLNSPTRTLGVEIWKNSAMIKTYFCFNQDRWDFLLVILKKKNSTTKKIDFLKNLIFLYFFEIFNALMKDPKVQFRHRAIMVFPLAKLSYQQKAVKACPESRAGQRLWRLLFSHWFWSHYYYCCWCDGTEFPKLFHYMGCQSIN